MLTVELTVLGRGPVIRAEASAADKFAAFDLAYNKLLERLRRAKDRKKVHHGRHTPKAVREATATLEPASTSEPLYVEASHARDRRRRLPRNRRMTSRTTFRPAIRRC